MGHTQLRQIKMRFEKKFVAVVGLAPTTCGLVPAALPLLSYTAPIFFIHQPPQAKQEELPL